MTSGLNPYNFTISDQSPLLQYLPFRDGPIITSWNVTYSGDSDSAWVPDAFIGSGPSSHRTTLAGASVQLDWTGTAVYLYGEASAGGYTIQIDGSQTNTVTSSSGLLFSQSGLSYGTHSLVLQVVLGEVTISNATITVGMGGIGTTVQNRTIATTSVPLTTDGIVLSDGWISQPYTYSTTGTPDPRIGTTTQGSSISFPLTSASAFSVLGSVNYNHGSFVVTVTPPSDLGSPQVGQYNGSSRWIGLGATLYLETGMDRSKTYQVQVTNNSPGLWLDLSQIVVFDTPPSSPSATNSSRSSSHPLGTGTIVGIAIGGVLVLVLVLLVSTLILLCIRRRRQRGAGNEPNAFRGESITPSYANPAFMTDQPSSGVSYDWSPTNLVPRGVDVPAWNAGVLPSPISTSTLPSDPASTAYLSNSPMLAPLEARGTSPNQPPFATPSRSPKADVTTHFLPPPESPPLSSATLTNEQAELVQSLLRHSVPVSAVAGVMEGLLRGEGQSGANLSNSGADEIDQFSDSEALPSYDFKST